MTRGSRLVGVAGFLLATALGSRASAQDAAARCAESYEDAQLQRSNGKYMAAIEEAKACSQLECNVAISRECVKLFETLQAEVPTLVFSAHDPSGKELTNVRVSVDGKALLDHLDGKPLAFDPGLHTFHFEIQGQPPVDVTHTARVGDQNRLIEAMLGQKPADKASEADTVSTRPRTVPVATYVLAGAGVVSLGVFGYLRISGIEDYNEKNQSCSPTCSQDDVDRIHAKFQLSYVALGVGVAALGGAAAFYFLQSTSEAQPAAQVGMAPTPGGASAQLKLRF